MRSREAELVELVDGAGSPIGVASVALAHRRPGLVHRAFSVVLMSVDGRVLLQRRAAVKTRFPLLWANTCCGHPAPGESVHVAARRRLHEELGIAWPADPAIGAPRLIEHGVLKYEARDLRTEFIECEFDHVLCATVDIALPLAPCESEVAETRWVPIDGVTRGEWPPLDQQVPWLQGVLGCARRVQ